MIPFAHDWLVAEGFVGFETLHDLDTSELPKSGGVYIVVRTRPQQPIFLTANPAGRFKDKDPTVAPSLLAEHWIENCSVIYIGKAASVATRLRQYRDFGAGKPIGHWGGRYIWQLEDAHELIVCWKAIEGDPRAEERALLSTFIDTFGRLPFANLAR